MAAEHVAAAAVIGQRRKRLERLILALARAEIALQPPERGDDRGRHAEFLLLACKDRLVFPDLGRALLQPVGGQHLVGELKEVLREEALPAVDADDALVEHEIGRSSVDRGRRDALGGGLLLEIGKPAFEAAGIAAICVLGQSGRRRAGPAACDEARDRRAGKTPPHKNLVSHRIVRCYRRYYHRATARFSLCTASPASPPSRSSP